ncbi:coiled-coil domain-containing protein 30 [Polymixia lowei]
MEREEELDQIARWLREEGLVPDAPTQDQLCFLWRVLQHRESRLVMATRALDTQRSQHIGEMAEVRKSLAQIRTSTEEKNVLALEIQEENDNLRERMHSLMSLQEEKDVLVQKIKEENDRLKEQLHGLMSSQEEEVLAEQIQQENDYLREQLHGLMSLHDAQQGEVAEMLRQQGLAEVMDSSPSEQVAYLLVERAAFLEKTQGSDGSMGHGSASSASQLKADAQVLKANADQSPHKGAPRHGQSPWKRLFGLRKAAQSKHTFIPAEARQALHLEQECSRLERDLDEGSRRLAMAHNEIRHLTDELESARLAQSAYEPELQGAQQEVEQVRQEVDKLKKREMVELRKAKELNDRLDQEIRALRTRVRSLDAEKSSLKETLVSLQKEVQRLESDLQEQQVLTVQAQTHQANEFTKTQAAEMAQSSQTFRDLQKELTIQTECLLEKETAVVSLQKEVGQLESALEQQQQQAKCQLVTMQTQAECQAAKLAQSNQTCRDLQKELTAQTKCLLANETTVVSLQREVDRLEFALQEQRQAKQQLLSAQAQANQANELAKSQAAELTQRDQTLRDLQKKLTIQTECLLVKETAVVTLQKAVGRLEVALQDQQQQAKQQLLSMQAQAEQSDKLVEVQNLKHQLENSHNDLDILLATYCSKEHACQNQNKLWKQREAHLQHELNTVRKFEASSTTQGCHDNQELSKQLLATQDECDNLKKEICETLQCLDEERSTCLVMNEKHKARLYRAKQKLGDEIKWRDQKIDRLERELSLCVHSAVKEKELIANMTVVNEKLLFEKSDLLKRLNEEENIKNDSILAASLSKRRVDFLELENKNLENKILQMSNQLAALERTLRNIQPLYSPEEVKKMSSLQNVLTSGPLQTSSAMQLMFSDIRVLLDNIQSSRTKQTQVTFSPLSTLTTPLSGSAEMSYLNLTSVNSCSERLAPSGSIHSTDSNNE